MPVSKKRKKAVYTPPPPVGGNKKGPSPVWLAPVMLACFIIGVVWLVVFYMVGNSMPIVGHLGTGNLLIGFGFIIAGFGLSTQWR